MYEICWLGQRREAQLELVDEDDTEGIVLVLRGLRLVDSAIDTIWAGN